MITFTERLDKAIRLAAWAHEQQGQHRKGTDIPYIIHPFGVMLIAGTVTEDEDTLIACLFHDVLEDVRPEIYDEAKMRQDFGDAVVAIVKDVTHNGSQDWHARSNEYLKHLEGNASDQAVIVSISDKIHNLTSTLIDYETHGDELWQRFTTKNAEDQLWWYESILRVAQKRNAPQPLLDKLASLVRELKVIVTK